ncbi:phosphatidylinositol-4-phosphate 5-kinase [Thermoascus aurantiacus ATCC 26904]
MASQKSQGTSSPSASSIFLPLGRRGSRASLSTQAERENLNEALDQIHSAAYQSDSLTVFNEFTNPPVSSPVTDNKGLTGDIQGGLSGLYSRFRASVGGVKDIVAGSAKPSDSASGDSHAVKCPNGEQTALKSPSGSTTVAGDSQPSYPNSAQGSKLQSPVSGTFPSNLDGTNQAPTSRSSKLSSKAASVSSKTSLSSAPAMKSPVAPLAKTAGGSSTADPAVTELNVNAVKDGSDRSRGNSASVSSHAFQNADASSVEKDDSLGPSSRKSHSPVLTAKQGNNQFKEVQGVPDSSRPQQIGNEHLVNDKSKRSNHAVGDRHAFPEPDTSLPGSSWKGKQMDATQDDQPRENLPASSSNSSIKEPTAPTSATNSLSRIPNEETSVHEGRTPDRESNSALASKPCANKPREKLTFRISQSRLPGYVMSRASSTETATANSAVAAFNTNLDRTTSQDSRGKRAAAQAGDVAAQNIVMSQLRSRLLSRDFWMRDENAKDCFHCGEPFSTFRRKHHCRTCGQIFDAKCTLLISGAQFGQSGTIRVCKPCEAMINAHEDDSSDFSDNEPSPGVVNPLSDSGLNGNGNGGRPLLEDDDASSVISQSLEHAMKTPTMAIPATRRAGEGHNRRSAVLEIDSDRPLTRPTSSRSLKSSLNGRPHFMGHKRYHSRQQYIRSFKSYHDDRAPFQRRFAEEIGPEMHLPAFHKDSIIDPDLAQYLSDDASSGDEQPNLFSAVSDSTLSKSGGDSEKATFGGFLAAVKKGRSRFGDRSGASGINSGRDADDGSISSSKAVNLPRSTRRRNLSVASSIHQRASPRTSRDNVFNTHEHSSPGTLHPPGATTSGFKMTRSSSMRGAGAPAIELPRPSLQHVRKLLRQLLKDASVPHAHSWETALMPILLKATDDVDPDVQHGDDMDIRHYVKLKKIPGGRPGDTSYISGLVFTKNLALKSMPRSIPRPNILIITFALEYARHQQHFMSLEPVIRQEREFLENLVSRIAALRPNLLLVEKNVSGLALEFLEKANIATAYNVKPSVLEAVSRCTQTRIITSMDKLVTTPAPAGQCGSFDLKTYVYNGRKKTYMYISGCPKELGCTIVLRGASEDVLAKIKRITEFMIYVVYNLKLETCLMRDEFAQIPTSSDDGIKKGVEDTEGSNSSKPNDVVAEPSSKTQNAASNNSATTAAGQGTDVPDDVPMPTFYEDMVQKHETKILSASPFVKFEPPYLLMRARELERKLAYLKRLRDQDLSSDQSSDDKTKSQKFVLITPEMVHQSPHGASAKVKEVLHAVHDAEYDTALHNYQTQKRQWEAYISGNANLFDPYAHQNIFVLYSLVCTTTSIPCSGPDIFALEFYNEHDSDRILEADCTLGQYVEDLCLSANAVCTINGCEKRMFEHHRQYVHGEAQISVFVQPYPCKLRGLQDTILMWSCCKICGNETQVMPMSDSTWKYSFGKYLELSFWSKDLHARAGVCPHDLHRDHLRYFGFKDVALRIQYDPISLLEIIVPRTRVTWKVENDLRLRNEVYSKIEHRLNKFMASVKARLKSINVESVMPELVEDCRRETEALMKKANEDHAALIKQLQDKYMNSRYYEVIPLNEVLRSVQEKVVEWDAAFAEFEKNFFPSEKDIRRLAALQLKKIFLDKEASVTSLTTAEEPSPTPAEPGTGEATATTDRPGLVRRMTLSPEKAQDVLASVVEEHSGKISKEKVQAEEDEQSVPSAKPEGGVSTVQLANPEESRESSASQVEAATQEEVRHLDLALPSSPSERSPSESNPTAGDSNASEGDLPTPRPLTPLVESEEKSSNPLSPESMAHHGKAQKIEKVGRPGDSQPPAPAVPPSGIPKPAESGLRRGGKAKSPPLFRANSQPVNLQRERNSTTGSLGALKPGFGSASGKIAEGVSSPPCESKVKVADKKLSDRLGLSALKTARSSAGHTLIPRSAPGKKKNSRVSSLARHFEQLSREFEKERQRERQQRAAKGKHSRAYPMASSKPIVEVYKNVREAVEEREPSGEGEDFMSQEPPAPSDEPSRESVELSRKSLEVPPDQEPAPGQASVEPTEQEDNARANSQIASEAEAEAEAEEEHSDEERSLAEDLQITDSPEELAKLEPDEALDLKELPKHERSTLVRLLTNFWAERSASGWAPLDYPLKVSDHVFADSNIIVREDEPSSLIAFALDSEDYKTRLASIQKHYEEMEERKSDLGGDIEAENEARVEQALLRATGTHLKYQFQEGQAKMLCKIFYAEQFDALRRKCGVADRIVESLSRCAKWDSKGGKTKSLFLKTLDDRFILKSLSTIETQAFLKFAPAYFQIMSEALFHELPSAIAKMFGFYQVIIKNPASGVEFNWFLLLMENLFYDRVPTRIFDLKGSMRNRKVQSTGERNEVLLDENMVDFIYETPLFAREHSKKLLSQSVWNDTLFLGRQNVMDYSLMIAIDENRKELVVGIIDCIRTYTWDKKLESWIKDRGFAGGGKNRPTVTSPKEYKSRFREAMARYVLHAPNCWQQFQPTYLDHRHLRIDNNVSHAPGIADMEGDDRSAEPKRS